MALTTRKNPLGEYGKIEYIRIHGSEERLKRPAEVRASFNILDPDNAQNAMPATPDEIGLTCYRCREIKHVDEFYSDKRNKLRYGRRSVCKVCMKIDEVDRSKYRKQVRTKRKKRLKKRRKQRAKK